MRRFEPVVYKYLYQDRENNNREGEIKARNRADAYMLLRKQGIRPYRVIGDDPRNWRPWVIAAGYAALLTVIVVLTVLLVAKVESAGADAPSIGAKGFYLSPEEARLFREKAEEAVLRAPEAYRYNVWVGVNVRLAERGLDPIEKPDGLTEE